MSTICIFHGSCQDGFASAWAVRAALGDIEFHAAQYGSAPPDCFGKDVVIVDFTYPLPVLKTVAHHARSVLILDHHKSAMEDLKGLPEPAGCWQEHLDACGRFPAEDDGTNLVALFDMTRSGAGLAWGYFHRGKPMPDLIRHVQDRDLWQFKDSNTKAYCAGLASYSMSFAVWDVIASCDEQDIVGEGEAILRYQAQRIAELKPLAYRCEIGGHDVPMVNAPYFMASDLAGELAEGEKFAATYYETDKGVTISLRSRGGFDVSAIAKMYGGGGHAGAAGFTILHAEGPPRILATPEAWTG